MENSDGRERLEVRRKTAATGDTTTADGHAGTNAAPAAGDAEARAEATPAVATADPGCPARKPRPRRKPFVL